MFDSVNKPINYVLKNRLLNELFNVILLEKPDKIIRNEHFRLILQLLNKTSSNKILNRTIETKVDHRKGF
jgi:hypothetical protein